MDYSPWVHGLTESDMTERLTHTETFDFTAFLFLNPNKPMIFILNFYHLLSPLTSRNSQSAAEGRLQEHLDPAQGRRTHSSLTVSLTLERHPNCNSTPSPLLKLFILTQSIFSIQSLIKFTL